MKLAAAAAVFLTATPCLAEDGVASVYVDVAVACPGERYSASSLTAAHRTIPCGTLVEVVNVRNGRRVVVRIVDRRPFRKGRVIDLTPAAAKEIDLHGLGPVRLAPVPRNKPRGEAPETFDGLWAVRAAPEP